MAKSYTLNTSGLFQFREKMSARFAENYPRLADNVEG